MAEQDEGKMGCLKEIFKNRYTLTEEGGKWKLRQIKFVPALEIEKETAFDTYEEAEKEIFSKKPEKFLIDITYQRGLGLEGISLTLESFKEDVQNNANQLVEDYFKEKQKNIYWGKLKKYQFKIIPLGSN